MSDLLEQQLKKFYGPNFQDNFGTVAGKIILPSRTVRTAPMPQRYVGTEIGKHLQSISSSANGIYRHQSLSGKALDEGNNVVVTTNTNSGKSRIFRGEAFYQIETSNTARILVLSSTRNLNTNQYESWKRMAVALGHDPEIIGRIDGSVPEAQRFATLSKSRIVIATPDIMHSWFMSNLEDYDAYNFLKNRQLTVIDEIGSLNSYFGSNVLYLLRRMQNAQQKLAGRFDNHRYIGASATIKNPASFFTELTGQKCTIINESDNGAPQHEQMIAHHAVDTRNRVKSIKEMALNMAEASPDDMGMISFDSRRGVEQMAAAINAEFGQEIAVPQKAGQSHAEQQRLDALMMSGDARVIVATSSMELGVNYDLGWGINVGIPISNKAFFQRRGRIGRHRPGIFVIAANGDAFTKNKRWKSFENYVQDAEIEDIILYGDKPAIQIAQAFCLRDEDKQLRESGVQLHPIPREDKVMWHNGFSASYKLTEKPNEALEGPLRLLIPPRMSRPQYHAPLRNINGGRFVLSESTAPNKYRPLGECSLDQALNEYPPGAIVWHQGMKRRVTEWDVKDHISRVVMEAYTGENTTRHHQKTSTTIRLNTDNVVGKKMYRAKPSAEDGSSAPLNMEQSFIALTGGRITRTVNSFIELSNGQQTGSPYVFLDNHEIEKSADETNALSRDYGPKRRARMATTGVLMHLPGFRVSDKQDIGVKTKRMLLDMILNHYCDSMQIERRDINVIDQDIAVWVSKETPDTDDYLYFYDQTPGELGLSHGLITDPDCNIKEILAQVKADLDPEEDKALVRACALLSQSLKGMQVANVADILTTPQRLKAPTGHILVVPHGCEALHEQSAGSSTRVTIAKPIVVEGTYGYMVKQTDRTKAFENAGVPASASDNALSFVAASQIISLDPTNRLAMHKKTGAFMRPDPDKKGEWIRHRAPGS